MRKTIALLILLTQFSCAHHSQDSLTFKIQFKPEKKYSQTIERTSQTVLKYSGSEKSLQILKDRGVKNPTITNKKFLKESILKTGKLIDGTIFPCTVEFIKTTNSDGKKDISDGAIFHGQCSIGNMPIFYSVALDGLDEKYKITLIQTLQNTFSQLSFPEKKLKIGEQFSIEHPLSIPMEGSTVEMVVTTTYKLISISNGIASFNISQMYIMNPTLLDNSS